MQTAAVNQLITDQLTKFVFNGDNRLQFLSGFPEVAAHFGFTELIYGEPPMARPDIRDEGVELACLLESKNGTASMRWPLVSSSTNYMKIFTKLCGRVINLKLTHSTGVLQPTFWALSTWGL